ncbi:uncharacterized protein LOC115985138 [Quercus lobata]|uniref:uncharacterized protein LOC115985138 n=1 Tax=Quercus lobata TaxID=97700 RepID=UPI001248CDA8|nr:uncharacterized protein LOC115985138 [Quercus lobata]
MHLWRIAANCLPTKSLLARYINIGDTTCSFCGLEEETCLHLFVMCPLTKAIWFNSHWGFKFDGLGLSSSSQFIQTLISPPNAVGLNPSIKAEFLLHGAVICDVVWKLRNQVQFEGISPNLEGMLLKISRSVAEFRKVLESPLGSSRSRIQSVWSKPDRDTIKVNVDVAYNTEKSSIAAIARDWRGGVVFACSKRVNTTLPLQAEAEAIIWALNLAANLDTDSIFIESDSKTCIDALKCPNQEAPWRIKTICNDVLALKSNFSNCSFSWVAREANVAAHVLAKWSLSNNYFGSFDVGLGPPCFVSVIRAEALSLAV